MQMILLKFENVLVSFLFFCFHFLRFSFETSDKLTVYIGSWLMIKFVSCLLIILEFLYLKFSISWKSDTLNRTDNAINKKATLHNILVICSITSTYMYGVRCAIWCYLCNLKNVKNIHGGVLVSVKLQAEKHPSRSVNFSKVAGVSLQLYWN